MKKDLQASIKKVVRDNLPSQVAGELKVFFEEHSVLKKEKKDVDKELEEKEKEIVELNTKIKNFEKGIEDLNNQLLSESELLLTKESVEQMRIGALETQRLNEISRLTTELNAEQRYANNVTEFMLNLSKNSVVKRKFSGDVLGNNFYHQNTDGSSQSRDSTTHQIEQETTVEEE